MVMGTSTMGAPLVVCEGSGASVGVEGRARAVARPTDQLNRSSFDLRCEAMHGDARLLSLRLSDISCAAAAKRISARSAEEEIDDDVDRDWGRHASPCPSVLHHARDRGQEERRASAGGGGGDRKKAACAQARSLDH